MRPGDTGFAKLFRKEEFSSKIIALVLDEAHCITQWGSFRPEYKDLSRLHSQLPGVIFHITSATLPRYVIDDVLRILNIKESEVFFLRRSNDRSNVAIVVREIQHPLASYADLDFLVDGWASGGSPPPKFLILFDSKNDCVKAARHLRSKLPAKDRKRIIWHNSDMSTRFRAEEVEEFQAGISQVIGMLATDTLGMVSNLLICYLETIDGLEFLGYGYIRLSICRSMEGLGSHDEYPIAASWKSCS